jgi:hypothetical protein
MRPERDETDAERMDRNWNELLQELRVTQTGIQILAGFLVTLPFQQRFTSLTRSQQALYLTAVGLAMLSTGLVVAPVISHRILFRRHEKDVLVAASNALAKAGLAALMLTVVAVMALIFSVVVGGSAGILAGGVTLGFFLLFWVALPVLLLRKNSAG